jgi:3-isopropylmalate/(R)-2-methylmalate dehydratase small subunit
VNLDAIDGRARLLHRVVSTDDIIPAKYKHMETDPALLAEHVFENMDPEFGKSLRRGDILVSTDTFGIGSSREQAVTALASAGVMAVVAPRFGSIFFRNAWNNGLPAVAIRDLEAHDGARITVRLTAGELIVGGVAKPFRPIPRPLQKFILAGGLLTFLASGGRLENV